MDTDASFGVSERSFPNSLEDISKHFGLLQALVSIKGPLSLRRALGVSQAAMGELLGHYLPDRNYTRGTIATWERSERHVALPARYAMTDKARGAYHQLLADVVHLAGAGKFRLKASMGQRVWHFKLERDCVSCGRPFRMRRSDAARCRRCLRKGKQ
jgi:hypothetical protein